MCIAILNTKDEISAETLAHCWQSNKDGAGLLYAKRGRLFAYKSLHLKPFLARYKQIRQEVKGNIVIHFRMATHGSKTIDNAHPFMVNKSLGFVHNGIIDIDIPKSHRSYSDTNYFCESVLKKLPLDFLKHDGIRFLIEQSIGWSKLIFLDHRGNAEIIGEKRGLWDGTNWYSNTGYRKHAATQWPTMGRIATSTTGAAPERGKVYFKSKDENEFNEVNTGYYDVWGTRETSPKRLSELTDKEYGEWEKGLSPAPVLMPNIETMTQSELIKWATIIGEGKGTAGQEIRWETWVKTGEDPAFTDSITNAIKMLNKVAKAL